MFEGIASKLNAWRERHSLLLVHTETLNAYRSGKYPKEPTIGIGLAFQKGLLDAKVFCRYAWCQKALHEGPIFLQAWRKASKELEPVPKSRFYVYRPELVLDVALGLFKNEWTQGWLAESLDDTRSSSMRVVNWIQERDPHWIGNNLDFNLFASSMSVWDALLYHDTSTSAWAMKKWPDRILNHQFPWSDWLNGVTPWMYPITQNAYSAPKEEWTRIAQHIQAWSPLLGMMPEEQLRKAITLLGFPKKEIRHGASDRGILWKALTNNVPLDIAGPIGAALACAWPDMSPDCVAIKRHFYPELGNATVACDVARQQDNGFPSDEVWSSGAWATLFLYDTPSAWVNAVVDAWSRTKENLDKPAIELDLPLHFLD